MWQADLPQTIVAHHLATAPSLTVALSQLGQFSVMVQYMGAVNDAPDFADYALEQHLFCREVILSVNNQPVVLAKSFCPPHSVWQEIMNCGNTSLGNQLFSNQLNGLYRSQLTFQSQAQQLLARRSWFSWQNERLYLVERFLPNIIGIQHHLLVP